jgi:hypothetical protein
VTAPAPRPELPQETPPVETPKRSKVMLAFYVGIGVVAIILVGLYFTLTPRMTISEDAPVRYENRFVQKTAVVPEPLAIAIIRKLNGAPDQARWRAGMGHNTKKYLRVGPHTLQVMTDEVILLDGWGVRQWTIRDIEKQLEVLLTRDQK